MPPTNRGFLNPKKLFYFVAFTPIIVQIIAIGMHFGLRHNVHGRVPTASETVEFMPESRIFSVAMHVVAWACMMIFLVIDGYTEVNGRPTGDGVKVVRYIANSFAVISFISLMGLASVTLVDEKKVNIAFTGIFAFATCVYFIMRDVVFLRSNIMVSYLSWSLDAVMLAAMILGYILSFVNESHVIISSAGSVFGYIGGLTLFLKFAVIGKSLPVITLQLARKE